MFEPEWVKKYKTMSTDVTDCITRLDYSYDDEFGWSYLCKLYDGIFLWANDVHMSKIPCEQIDNYHYIKINICLEGHCEVLLADGRYVYLEPGIMSIDANQSDGFYQYQTKSYRGIEIAIDTEQLERMPLQWATDFGLSLEQLTDVLNKRNGSFLGRADLTWITLAESIYKHLIYADQKLSDLRFLCVQFLYEMKNGRITAIDKDIYLTKGQREIAQSAEAVLTNDLSIRYSIEELAKRYKVSPSSLKKYFELRYGNPVSVYMREKRLEAAKRLLKETDKNVVEIAERMGYISQGEFCGAFKKYVGVTPLEYRRLHMEGDIK